MRNYKLTIAVVAVFKKVSFIADTVNFNEESLEKALIRAKEILKERKNGALEKLNRLVKGEGEIIQISEAEKDELMKTYPTKTELVETIIHTVDIE